MTTLKILIMVKFVKELIDLKTILKALLSLKSG